jgi:hypothetical protein
MIKDFYTFINENKIKEGKQIHYFYKIINKINGHFYYGIHSTYNINDGYMGSGTGIRKAIKEFGKENFEKEILKEFPSRSQALQYEKEIVNQILVKDKCCYNISIGGSGHPHTTELVTVTDGKTNFVVSIDDERYKNGELKGVTKGKAHYLDELGNVICITPEEANLRGLRGFTVGKVAARKIGSNDSFKMIRVEDFDSSIYETPSKGYIITKDSEGNTYKVLPSDERYISGELKPIFTGKKHKEETIEKMKVSHQKNGDKIGEKNSQYGTIWLIKPDEHKEMKFKPESEEDIITKFKEGWIPGRIQGATSKWYEKYLETGEIPNRFYNSHGITKVQKLYNSWKLYNKNY